MQLSELHDALSWEDSSLMENDEETVLSIQDTRPTIQVARTFHLMWQDITLATFPATFLEEESMRTRYLTHVDLSYNKLSSLPTQLFQLPLLESLDISHNHLVALPCQDLWKHDSQMQVIKASYNHLRGGGCVATRISQSGNGRVICHALWHIDLSHNLLTHFPPFLLHFSLKHLDISHNPAVSEEMSVSYFFVACYFFLLSPHSLPSPSLPLSFPPPFLPFFHTSSSSSSHSPSSPPLPPSLPPLSPPPPVT